MGTQQIRKLRLSLFGRKEWTDYPIWGDIVSVPGGYEVKYWEEDDSMNLPPFFSPNADDIEPALREYVYKDPELSRRVRRLKATGCKLPVLLINSYESGCFT